MKRLIFIIGLVLCLSGSAWADGWSNGQANTISMTAMPGGIYTPTTGVNIEGASGHFGICGRVTGSGTARLDYMISADNITYVIPAGANAIISGYTSSSGPGGDGYFCTSFAPDYGRWLKLKLSETASSNPVTLTGTFLIEKR